MFGRRTFCAWMGRNVGRNGRGVERKAAVCMVDVIDNDDGSVGRRRRDRGDEQGMAVHLKNLGGGRLGGAFACDMTTWRISRRPCPPAPPPRMLCLISHLFIFLHRFQGRASVVSCSLPAIAFRSPSCSEHFVLSRSVPIKPPVMTINMAFITTPLFHPRQSRRASTSALRMTQQPPESQPPKKMPVTNSPPSKRKLVRNKPDTGQSVFADARAGDMVGAPQVGEGLGPRRGVKEKKVTRAAAIQKSQGFADAWAEQNQGRVDVWLIIGALTLLTPLVILAWAIATGVIPTGGLFED